MRTQTRSALADACPGRDQLAAYSLGTLPIDRIGRIAAHLENCSKCLETLGRLDDCSDSLVTSLAGIHEGTTSTSAEERRIIEHLAAIRVGLSHRPTRDGTPPRQVGPYEILEPLAEGGMGAVYKARHIHLGKIVALKLLSADRVADGSSIARFMQEMKALGQLSHPNIVQAHDAGVESVPYLAMEFLHGMDLARLVKQRGALPVPQACECVRQASLALQHAFSAGLVHRDIKPSNLLLTPEGCVKLLDLGLARIGADLPRGHGQSGPDGAITSVGVVMGTMDYIAPEQLLDSRSVDGRADLYSLGCTLYFLLTGRPPFGRASDGNNFKRRAHLIEPAPDIRQIRPEVPEELAVIVDRLLAKNPAYRFGSPAELSAALQPLAAGCTLAGLTDNSALGAPAESGSSSQVRRPGSSVSPVWQQPAPPRQPHLFALTLILVTFMLAVGFGYALWAMRAELERRDNPDVADRDKAVLKIESMQVDHFRDSDRGLVALGTVGAQGARRGPDSFRVTANVSEPAHLYLIAYLPDGKSVVCVPELSKGSAPTRNLVYPREGLMRPSETGMHLFVLLAARKPLPADERWRTAPPAWPKHDACEAGAWKFDGHQFAALTRDLAAPPPAAFKEICNVFAARRDVEAVQAVAFCVLPEQPPSKTDSPKN